MNTQNDLEKALKKIKKCFALSASSNQHEAEAALRQAHALMKIHGLSDVDVTIADIAEIETNATSKKISAWEGWLSGMIGRQFGILSVSQNAFGKRKALVTFIGTKAKAQIAQYAFIALRRQLQKDRRKQALTTARQREAFAMGWISAVTEKVSTLAEPFDETINIYQEKHYPALKESKNDIDKKIASLRKNSGGAMYDGYLSGQEASLHAAVDQNSEGKLGINYSGAA